VDRLTWLHPIGPRPDIGPGITLVQ
jgi:hypothetical protein